MKSYNHSAIEKKWQKKWGTKAYKTLDKKKGAENFYLLTEFPYPSGNLHVGHWYAFAVPDILARYMRMRGKNVLYPIGFDAFGLPAENAALQRGLNPRTWTYGNIASMRKQFTSMGASFDWSREVVTADPVYYKWTQWLFLQLYKRGLVYRKKTPVNWCPKDKTVLANEQVKDGKCERCDTEVEQKQMEQWNIKITDYAERLLNDLDGVNFPEEIKAAQRNWIGKSEGAEIEFQIRYNPSPTLPKGKGEHYGYYSTDTLHFRSLHEKAIEMRNNPTEAEQKLWHALKGDKTSFHFRQQHIIGPFIVDFVCLSHSLVVEVDGDIHDLQKERDAERSEMLRTLGFQVLRFSNKEVLKNTASVVHKIVTKLQSLFKSKVLPFGEDLGGVELEKIKVFTTRPDTLFGVSFIALAPSHPLAKDAKNLRAINPANNEEVPVFVADYVVDDYGTGAVMGVPAHDERDREFALKNNIPIKNAEFASSEIVEKFTKKTTQYKLRDWTVSRQRYWGVPIPLIKCEKPARPDGSGRSGGCGWVAVPENKLPVKLPEIKDYIPTGDGRSPLAKARKWVEVKCPQCRASAERETDTLDTFVDSSWYFLRYADPKNKKEFSARAKMDAWLPVDFYSGGAEHTTIHLLYSRFWHKALFDLGLVANKEPYARRMNRGLILGPDGQKMSKSRGNVVDPDEEVKRLGADTVRMYLAFIGPYGETSSYPWDKGSIAGIRRFLERVWRLQSKIHPIRNSSLEGGVYRRETKDVLIHQTIKKVGEDIPALKFNTATASLMVLANALEKETKLAREDFAVFVRLLAPFAPHMTEELWSIAKCGKGSVHSAPWPVYDEAKTREETVTIVVQVNGKVRGSFQTPRGISEADAFSQAEKLPAITEWLSGKTVSKRFFVKDRLVSFVVA